ncbi:MAG TPA: trypsin [Elusimicrobia bacterium]|nr:MAG: hypothetical protein A2089_06250 [Elusimicrobia bacterium GWD2_63_28]HCC48016.1 trypsin [Elusimicrobiota bacterium]
MKTLTLIRKMLAPALLLGLLTPGQAQVQDLGEGSMQVAGAGSVPRILPLKHTEVKAEISGFVAEVRVTQVFTNPADAPIEAVYVFPLPENAAVNEMTLVVAGRTIKGEIKKREEARREYEAAKALGQTAALLDQERPNIFTQSVANLPPGKEIRVTLKYIQDLGYDHGVYKFNFPMTVGPRYIPGAAAVQDASRITPPVVKPGQRSGRDISVEVKLNAGIAVKNIRSNSHEITLKLQGENGAEIGLDPDDSIPNKDFLLTYEPSAKMVDVSVLAHKEGKEGYLTLMVQPGADFPLEQVTPKELVFALDVSGSMGGFPIETAKETALRCLEGMNPGDTFQIFTFASGNRLHFERPLRNTPENVALGRSVINELRGGGGTEMLDALQKVLEFPKDPERMRIVLFMTDGFVGDDREILGFVKKHLNNSRIFPLGVGSSPNRFLLEEMAVLGKGTVEYVRQDEKPAKLEKMIERFYDRISKPVLTDLALDWNGLDVLDATPAALPDLFAGQPVFIHARYKDSGSQTATLRGKMRGKPWKMSVDVNLPEREAANAAMGPLWARARIAELTREMYGNPDPGLKEDIVKLALRHKLVTQYTSFVAVDRSTATAGQKPLLVPVESELPEGTRYEGFFGGSTGGASGGVISAAPGAKYGVSGVIAAVRGKFSQAKGETYSQSLGFSYRLSASTADGGGARNEAESDKAMAAAQASGASRVAALAAELLTEPSQRLARQLVSLQDGSGAFTEPDGSKVSVADHALALLALVKARGLFGGNLDAALRNAWAYLKARQPAGLDGKAAVTGALKGGPHLSRSDIRAELQGAGQALAELK